MSISADSPCVFSAQPVEAVEAQTLKQYELWSAQADALSERVRPQETYFDDIRLAVTPVLYEDR